MIERIDFLIISEVVQVTHLYSPQLRPISAWTLGKSRDELGLFAGSVARPQLIRYTPDAVAGNFL